MDLSKYGWFILYLLLVESWTVGSLSECVIRWWPHTLKDAGFNAVKFHTGLHTAQLHTADTHTVHCSALHCYTVHLWASHSRGSWETGTQLLHLTAGDSSRIRVGFHLGLNSGSIRYQFSDHGRVFSFSNIVSLAIKKGKNTYMVIIKIEHSAGQAAKTQ